MGWDPCAPLPPGPPMPRWARPLLAALPRLGPGCALTSGTGQHVVEETGMMEHGMRMKAGTRLAAILVAGVAALAFSATSAPASTTPVLSPGSAATASSWTATATMSTARATPTATALSDGRILVVGGATAELYDPGAGAWSPAGTLSKPRSGYFVAVRLADGRVLVAGGPCTASAQRDDPPPNTW